jgi:ubiquitin-like 1-activating enzyme E1 A
MAAQAKIQSANILLITIKALGTEIAKNLILAGVGSLSILDDGVVTESDLGSQFFLSEQDETTVVGQNRAQAALPAAQKLNPRVQVHADVEGVKSKGPSYFGSFDIVIATDLDPDSFNLINTATRLNGRKFYAASTHGFYGFIFSDLIEHDYVIERDVGNVATQPGKQESRTRAVVDVKTRKEGTKEVESVTKRELYSTWFLASDVAILPAEYTSSKRRLRTVSPALSCLRALWEFVQSKGGRMPGNREDLKTFTQIATLKHKALGLPSETLSSEFLRTFLQNLGSEIAPVTAILGGQLAQDVINVLGQKEQPIQNMVIFDGRTMEALMYPLHPEGTLGVLQLSLAGNDPMMGNGVPDGSNGLMMGGMGDMGFDPSAMAAMPMPDGSFPMAGIVPGQMPMAMPDQTANGTAPESLPAESQGTANNGQAAAPSENQPQQLQQQQPAGSNASASTAQQSQESKPTDTPTTQS